jgi:predicted 3-demethylubiquinone-9 3-methyltransferase (glyoxalase superfamily)
MNKITPFLWFNDDAEAAVEFYVATFANSRIISTSRYGQGAPLSAGTLMSATFELEGRQFMALNGGPHFKFTEAISLFVSCEGQAEVDALWDRMLEGGGTPSRCGWLKDRFGLSWQIIPTALGRLLSDPATSGRAVGAMMTMSKIDIAALEAAAAGQ